MPGGMRSDIRGYQPAIEIVPRTTRISLSDRFRMLQSRPVVEQVRVVPGPVRNLQMALQMAGQSAQLPQRRLPVRQRLGPRPGVRVRNKHLLRLQHKAGFKKKLVQTMTVRRRPLHTRLTLKPVNSFRQKVPVHNGQNNTFRPRLVRNNIQLQGGRNAGNRPAGVSRFKWRNPNIILNQTGGQFAHRQPKASREELDSDLDSYMSQSRGYLNPNLDRFLQMQQ